tara:strand:- start:56 stop:217 length:162 start_codon:yes stop_codon:yes gene_type:complete
LVVNRQKIALASTFGLFVYLLLDQWPEADCSANEEKETYLYCVVAAGYQAKQN